MVQIIGEHPPSFTDVRGSRNENARHPNEVRDLPKVIDYAICARATLTSIVRSFPSYLQRVEIIRAEEPIK